MAVLSRESRILTPVGHRRKVPPGRERKPRRRRASTARPCCAAFLLVALWCAASAPADRAQTPGEYQIKAAFLFNFAKFIDWPPASFADPQSDFSICILGTDPFGRAMDDVLQGKSIGSRDVSIARRSEVSEVRHCQVVFVSASEKSRVREILEGLKGTNVLIVGETDGFAAAGGAIQFAIEDNHVRFLINTDAADRAGLKVSSKLLSLAHVVHDGEKGRS